MVQFLHGVGATVSFAITIWLLWRLPKRAPDAAHVIAYITSVVAWLLAATMLFIRVL